MKKLIILLPFLFLGCTTTPKTYNIFQSDFNLKIIDNVNLGNNKQGLPIYGRATVQQGYCQIELRKYPQCLLHEVRHCTEGNWHEGRETTEDCFNTGH